MASEITDPTVITDKRGARLFSSKSFRHKESEVLEWIKGMPGRRSKPV